MDSPIDQLLGEARALQRQGALNEAAQIYVEILRADPANMGALYHLAQVNCRQERIVEGIGLLRRLLSIDPRQARAHNLLGLALGRLGQTQEALASFNDAIAVDPNLADASSALGAGAWRTFLRVTLPLSAPGLVAGCILVFSACATAFVTQTLIGGARLIYMPLHIYQQAVGANNWPFAAAISVVFTLAVMVVIYALNRAGRTSKAYAHG